MYHRLVDAFRSSRKWKLLLCWFKQCNLRLKKHFFIKFGKWRCKHKRINKKSQFQEKKMKYQTERSGLFLWLGWGWSRLLTSPPSSSPPLLLRLHCDLSGSAPLAAAGAPANESRAPSLSDLGGRGQEVRERGGKEKKGERVRERGEERKGRRKGKRWGREGVEGVGQTRGDKEGCQWKKWRRR